MFVIARNRAISPETAWEENAFGCAICSQPRFAFEIWDLGSSPKIHGGCFLFVRIALVRAYLLATTAPLSLLSLSWPLPFFLVLVSFPSPAVCLSLYFFAVGRSVGRRRTTGTSSARPIAFPRLLVPTAVVEEGQSEQLPAQRFQPAQRPRRLALALVLGGRAQRERRSSGAVAAPAGASAPGRGARRDRPEETGSL